MKKALLIGFLIFSNGVYAQSKTGWVNITKKDMLPIEDAKIDSAIRSNKLRIDSIQSKLIIEKQKKKTTPIINSDDKSIYWCIIDVKTNKIIDTTVVIVPKQYKKN